MRYWSWNAVPCFRDVWRRQPSRNYRPSIILLHRNGQETGGTEKIHPVPTIRGKAMITYHLLHLHSFFQPPRVTWKFLPREIWGNVVLLYWFHRGWSLHLGYLYSLIIQNRMLSKEKWRPINSYKRRKASIQDVGSPCCHACCLYISPGQRMLTKTAEEEKDFVLLVTEFSERLLEVWLKHLPIKSVSPYKNRLGW